MKVTERRVRVQHAPVTYRDRWVYFFAESADGPISVQEARQVQSAKGYDPMGYGFEKFDSWAADGRYWAKWKCSASCD